MARAMKDSGIPWIGLIGNEFSVYRLKFLLSEPLTYGANESGIPFDESLPRYIRITDISSDGKLKNDNKLSLSIETAKDYLLKENDILLARSGASVGKAFIFKAEYGISAFAGYLIRARLKQNISSQYVFYYTQSALYEEWKKQTFIQSTIQNIGADRYNQLPVVLPCRQKQDAIVARLNTECARIDAVMEQTRASIEEYKKLKQSIITEAVTKGIRPNRPMKDSGIDWIGQIPEDWEVRRIKTLFDLRDEKNYLPLEEVNLISLYTDLGVVQHTDLEKTTGNKASNADGYKKVYENDIIVNIILCWMGAIGRSAYEGVTSPAYDIYIPKEKVDSRFYHHYFRTTGFSGDCYKRGKGIMAMRWRTYSDQFRDIKVVYPSYEEQQEVLEYLDHQSTAIDDMIASKQHLLEELECYKKSLIYEYVTGKKEVADS